MTSKREVIPREGLPTTRNLGFIEILKTQHHPLRLSSCLDDGVCNQFVGHHIDSILDERLQPGQCVIPLLGNKNEVLSHLLNRCRVEFE
jgi:hypothetical protein